MHLKSAQFHVEKYPTRDYYPFKLPLFQQIDHIDFKSPVTFFVGENGSGKSTLLKALCRSCGIHIWQNTETTRFENNPYEDILCNYISLEWVNEKVPGSYFGSDIFQYFVQILDEWAAADPGQLEYFGGKSLMTQSHGQSLVSFFKSRYRIKGLYLLDEPETALSPKNLIAVLQLIREMARDGHAQFIIATHSPILLACPAAEIYSFDHIPLKQLEYEETDHYRIYKSFMENRYNFLDTDNEG